MSLQDGGSKFSDAFLKKWNLVAGVLHSVQFVVQFAGVFAVPGVKDFRLPLVLNYQTFDNATQKLVSEQRLVGNYNTGMIVPFFLLASAIAHFTVISPWYFETYIRDINNGINRARWYEYALSSSLMIWAIAQFFGIRDIILLCLIFAINACMNLFGYMMEVLNQYTESVNWVPFWFGCWAGVWPWVAVFSSFLGSGQAAEIPGFVYGVLISYFIFFNIFPINMVLQYKKIGPWADYRFGEMGYVVLSLVSKSLLAWLVFGGTFQPN